MRGIADRLSGFNTPLQHLAFPTIRSDGSGPNESIWLRLCSENFLEAFNFFFSFTRLEFSHADPVRPLAGSLPAWHMAGRSLPFAAGFGFARQEGCFADSLEACLPGRLAGWLRARPAARQLALCCVYA